MLVKIGLGRELVWYTIYHHRNPVVKGVNNSNPSFFINHSMGIWDIELINLSVELITWQFKLLAFLSKHRNHIVI